MGVFLQDKNREYTYEQLLENLNQVHEYIPLYKTNDLFSFFANLVKAIISNMPLTLIDSDINPLEIDGIDASQINIPVSLSVIHFCDFNEIVSALQSSSSEITIFTSGTTGQPKKVIHSIQTLTRSVRLGEKYKEQIWAYAYNPTHMAGLQVFFQAFENQNALVNVFNDSRQEVYDKIDKYRITHVSATPTFYRLLLPYTVECNSVQRITLGGEKSDQRLYDNITKIFPNAKINNVYASTEAGTLFAAKGDCFQIPEAIKSYIKIVENELLIHQTLLGKSDSFIFDNGYYHSGDLIDWVDESLGIFKFKSRKNELINVGGYKVNPGEVEDSLNAIAGVVQSLVYGKHNSVLGNVLCAEVQLEDDKQLSEIEIRKLLKNQLQDFKIPRRIKIVDSLSLTRTGKLKRT